MAYFVFFLIDIYRGRKEKPRSENGLRIFSLIVKNQTIPFSLLQYLEEGEGNDLVPRGISLDSSFFKKSSPLKKRDVLIILPPFPSHSSLRFPKRGENPLDSNHSLFSFSNCSGSDLSLLPFSKPLDSLKE